MVCEPSWTAEVRPANGELLPQRPGAAGGFALQDWGRVHRTQTGSLGHRPQGDKDKILLVHFDLFHPAVVFISDAGYSVILAPIAQSEIGDACVECELDASLFQPFPQRTHHRVVLVVNRSHYPRKSVKA